MTRPIKSDTREKEDRLQLALTAFANKQKTATAAIQDYNVPRKTFYRRLSGVPPRNLAHQKDQFLTHTEEGVLVKWITQLTQQGYAPRHNTVRETAQYIRNRRNPTIGLVGTKVETLGVQWIGRFLGRHPELSSVMSLNIEGVRIKGTSPERLKKWFMDLGAALTEYKISPENLYNMDESGFAIGDIEASKVIINANIRQKFQAKWSRQEWVTSIECICADGTFVPPLVIFKGKKLL